MPRIAAHPSYPSVTEVLAATGLTRDYAGVPARYAQRGRALHEVIAMYLDGLAVENIAPELQPGLDAFMDFQAKEGYVSLHSELEMVHPYGFVGHLDLVGKLGGVTILDIKYTESPDVKGAMLQLAGYRLLYDHAHPDEKAQNCEVLQLSPTSGRYKRIQATDDYAMQVFTSALVVYRAKESR